MGYFKKFGLVLFIAIAFAACSSAPEEGDEAVVEDGAEEVATEAGTDAIPEDPLDDGAKLDENALAETPPEEKKDESLDAILPPPDSTQEQPVAAAEPVPEPAPMPEPEAPAPVADTSSSFGSGEMINYSVKTGDTLMKIAYETYGDLYAWKKIHEANRDVITDPNNIPKGTVLKIEKPSGFVSTEGKGEKYQIKTGDTLGSISKDVYGTPARWKDLWENNRQLIKDPNKIYAGFSLYYLPDAGGSPLVQDQGGSEEMPAADPAREPSSVAPAPAQPAAPAAPQGAPAAQPAGH